MESENNVQTHSELHQATQENKNDELPQQIAVATEAKPMKRAKKYIEAVSSDVDD